MCVMRICRRFSNEPFIIIFDYDTESRFIYIISLLFSKNIDNTVYTCQLCIFVYVCDKHSYSVNGSISVNTCHTDNTNEFILCLYCFYFQVSKCHCICIETNIIFALNANFLKRLAVTMIFK